MGSLSSLKSGANILGMTRPFSKVLFSRHPCFDIRLAFISGKALRAHDYERAKPWPYLKKGYNNVHCFFDHTTKRFDENSKVVFVEGLPAIGKSDFAEQLAEDLDMKYFPMVTMDLCYITHTGCDIRTLDPKLPKSVRSYDEKRFFREPKTPESVTFQVNELILKTHQYFDALAHIFNTGQGVVVERSPYSDFVFAEAMYKCGYFDKISYNAYYKFYNNLMELFMKPHLVIYLDAPTGVVTENLKKRGQGEEKAVTPEFLEVMDEKYKFKFLKDIEEHAEVLIYDWSVPGDVEVVVEDIERIDFDKYDRHEADKHHPKMKDWRWEFEWDANEARWRYTHRKLNEICGKLLDADMSCPALWADGDDMKVRDDMIDALPGMAYAPGFNPDQGDKILFKTRNEQKFPELMKRMYKLI